MILNTSRETYVLFIGLKKGALIKTVFEWSHNKEFLKNFFIKNAFVDKIILHFSKHFYYIFYKYAFPHFRIWNNYFECITSVYIFKTLIFAAKYSTYTNKIILIKIRERGLKMF